MWNLLLQWSCWPSPVHGAWWALCPWYEVAASSPRVNEPSSLLSTLRSSISTHIPTPPAFKSPATSNCSPGLADVTSETSFPSYERGFFIWSFRAWINPSIWGCLLFFQKGDFQKVEKWCFFPEFTDDLKNDNYLFHFQLWFYFGIFFL